MIKRKNKKHSREEIVLALKMYVDGASLKDIGTAIGLSGVGWESILYSWRKKAGIDKRENVSQKNFVRRVGKNSNIR